MISKTNTMKSKQIDSEVYKSKIRRGGLYNLTEEEIKIVEGKDKRTVSTGFPLKTCETLCLKW
jgi:hypothetical protein